MSNAENTPARPSVRRPSFREIMNAGNNLCRHCDRPIFWTGAYWTHGSHDRPGMVRCNMPGLAYAAGPDEGCKPL